MSVTTEQVTKAIMKLLNDNKWTLEYIDVYSHPSDDSVSVTIRGISKGEDEE